MMAVEELKQYKWDKLFIEFARLVAKKSTCKRCEVGCVITKNNRVISNGYNGSLKGLKHCKDHFKGCSDINSESFKEEHHKFAQKYEVHAEQNAIAFIAKHGSQEIDGATAYITLSPCRECAKLLAASGIKRVVYDELYDRDTEGISLLKEYGIQVEQFEDHGDLNDD